MEIIHDSFIIQNDLKLSTDWSDMIFAREVGRVCVSNWGGADVTEPFLSSNILYSMDGGVELFFNCWILPGLKYPSNCLYARFPGAKNLGDDWIHAVIDDYEFVCSKPADGVEHTCQAIDPAKQENQEIIDWLTRLKMCTVSLAYHRTGRPGWGFRKITDDFEL